MGLEEKVAKIEEAVLIMKDLLVSHDERLEDYFKALQESRKDFEFKINTLGEDFDFKMNALIDAQLKNEVEIAELKEASKLQLSRIEKLENN
jgi:hypothetical protein